MAPGHRRAAGAGSRRLQGEDRPGRRHLRRDTDLRPSLVDLVVGHPDLARLGGERRQVTVLFADIVGFTSFAEKHPAEEVVALLNDYLGEMTEIVFRWEGTLDKFVGDAVVAFWGAPLAQPNHGELALRCALHMIRRVGELQERWSEAGWPPLCVGVGLNTGDVIVGNIGAEGKKMDYTVIGDPVNLGARVESLTRGLGCHLLITDFTLEQVRRSVDAGGFGHVRIDGRGEVQVKGKQQRVNVFQVDVLAQGAVSEFRLQHPLATATDATGAPLPGAATLLDGGRSPGGLPISPA